jgi:gamma-glutamyltranspeptidase / glutathione hydrolase
VKMQEDGGGLITKDDLANYSGYWEEPLKGSYGEYTFYTNQTWNQGIVGLMTLQLLEGINLKGMGHNSPQYIHTVTQAIELAMADREAYVGDPKFVDVPLDVLLSKEYASSRQKLMTNYAFPRLPPHGKVQPDVEVGLETPSDENISWSSFTVGKDTTHLAIIDQWGNSISMTPSDFPKSPMVPGTGLTLGNRMTQFRLEPNDVNSLQPGKRPRVTPHAVIVFRNGRFYMSFGTPGDDMQTQALVQVFLNMEVFNMDIQHAIEAPRFRSMSMPATFAPHKAYPSTLWLESSLYDQTSDSLETMGYKTIPYPEWDYHFGAVGAVIQTDDGLKGGSDPREETWADGN